MFKSSYRISIGLNQYEFTGFLVFSFKVKGLGSNSYNPIIVKLLTTISKQGI